VRLGDADREQLFEQLKQHAVAGRIDVPELERRLTELSAAETREQAAALLADLPPLAAAPGPPRSRRGYGEADSAAADWQPTPERFRDPHSGAVMRVWVDSAGGRHYVADVDS
jgi:hypothetical protein